MMEQAKDNVECRACRREQFIKDNPGAMIPMNYIAHTCKECICEDLLDLTKSMAYCMEEARKEQPDVCDTWTPQELFEKGASWAGRHCKLTDPQDKPCT